MEDRWTKQFKNFFRTESKGLLKEIVRKKTNKL